MKKSYMTFTILCSIMIFGCSEDKESSIVGKWESDIIASEWGPVKHVWVFEKDGDCKTQLLFSDASGTSSERFIQEGKYKFSDSLLYMEQINKGIAFPIEMNSKRDMLTVFISEEEVNFFKK